MRFPTKDFVVAVFCALVVACGGGAPSDPVLAPVATVSIGAAPPSLNIGASANLAAEAYNANGQPVRGRAISWATSNAAIATVQESGSLGKVTAIGAGTVTITASSEGKTGSVSITVNPPPQCVADPLVSLAVGDVLTLNAQQKTLLCVAPTSTPAEYKLVISSVSGAASVSLIASNTVAITPSLQFSPNVLSARSAEWPSGGMSRSDVEFLGPAVAPSASRFPNGIPRSSTKTAALAAIPAEGDIVPLKANFMDGRCSAAPVIRQARVVSVRKNVIVYVEVDAPGGYTTEQFQSIAATFDTLGFPLDTLNFGAPPDVDNNGRISVFFTTGLGVQGINGVVLERDFESPATCSASNGGEFMYIVVPEPLLGGYLADIPRMYAQAPSIMVHELQHIISGGFRYPQSETTYLNEGLSHIAQELLFYKLAGLAPRSNLTTTFSNDAQRNAFIGVSDQFSMYFYYYGLTESSSPFDANGNSFATRGSIWNYLRYAADRRGGSEVDTWRALVRSNRTGVSNLSFVFGNYQTMFRDWVVSNVVDDVVPGIGANYTFPSWNYRGFKFDGPYPLAERALSTAPWTTTLVSGGAAYFRFGVAAGATAGLGASAISGGVTTADMVLIRSK